MWKVVVLIPAILAGFGTMAGCTPAAGRARSGTPATARAAAAAAATTAPAREARARLALDAIRPLPRMPAAAPTTAPGEAPLEAIELYARARDAAYRNQPFTAINLLEQAARIDPASADIQFLLANTYHRVGNLNSAINWYERAARVDPDDSVLQAEIGRAYVQRGEDERGIEHLRLARLAEGYSSDAGLAAAVDYRLAVALQHAGYDRAALEVYESLVKRLQDPDPLMRRHPEIIYLLNRPEFLLEQVARLHAENGQYQEALQGYQVIADAAPDDFAAQQRVVETLLAMRRNDDATERARRLVQQFKASPNSLDLLRETYRRAGKERQIIAELRRLHEQRPQDRMLLFALADAMEAGGRADDAVELLSRALEARGGADVEVLFRLADTLLEHGEVERCARVLIETSARRPQSTAVLMPLWRELTSPWRPDALRISDVRRLGNGLPADARAAHLYLVSEVCRVWNRSSLADQMLDRAVEARPVFAPAFRRRLALIWAAGGVTGERKVERSEGLVAQAREAGADDLATELQGRALTAQNRPQEAAEKLASALTARPDDPELELAHAVALRLAGDGQRFEQICWRLISDHPSYAETYPVLFRHHLDSGDANAARNVAETWLANMPENVEARLLDATVQLRMNRQSEQAERTLLRLFEEHPGQLEVLATLRAYYADLGKLADFVELLEGRREQQPGNYALVAMLVDVYLSQQRVSEASRAIDDAAEALSDDADRLYFVAHLYMRVDQRASSEEVLERILQIDPDFAPAGNDLGYTWADSGRNLDRAERLVRMALESEPNNPMYLDSLGWVLYKCGRFDEARRALEQAAAGAGPADPVVLDHLGDALYRLNLLSDAIRQWERSLKQIEASVAADGGDISGGGDAQQHNALRLELDRKLKQARQQLPVSVAPVVELPPSPPAQAKKDANERP